MPQMKAHRKALRNADALRAKYNAANARGPEASAPAAATGNEAKPQSHDRIRGRQ
jgi:hypothetical protein